MIIAAGLLIVSTSVGASEGAIITSASARIFTANAAAKIRAAYPLARVTVRKALEISVREKGRKIDTTLWLDRVFDLCAREPSACEAELDRLIRLIPESSPDRRDGAVRDKANLRVILRSTEAYRGTAVAFERGKDRVIRRTLADGLELILVVDMPETLSWATTKDFPADALAQDALIETGKQNTAKERSANIALRTIPLGSFTLVAGNAYDSSCMADHDHWAPLAQPTSGKFVVAVPGADSCLFGKVDSEAALAEFRQMVLNIAGAAQRPNSDRVYRWTPTGWTLLK
jgi:hypothetical protein